MTDNEKIQGSEVQEKIAEKDKPFWDWMMNLGVVKWFCNLPICKKCMTLKPFQMLFNYEMITYIFYGVLATVVNLVAFWVCCALMSIPMDVTNDSPYAFLSLVANAIAWVVALIFAFVTNKFIVFKSKDIHIKKLAFEFISFTVGRLISFGCEELIILIATITSFNLMIAKVIAAVIVVILNYIFSKLFIFKNKETKKKGAV